MIYENYERCGEIVAEIKKLEDKLEIVNSNPIITIKKPFSDKMIDIYTNGDDDEDFVRYAEDFVKEMQLNLLNRIDSLKVDLLKL